jgi:hypothetical protein
MADSAQVAERALQILEIMPGADPVGMLRRVASPQANRSDLKFAFKLLQLLDDGRVAEAESKLRLLEAWHQQCVGMG